MMQLIHYLLLASLLIFGEASAPGLLPEEVDLSLPTALALLGMGLTALAVTCLSLRSGRSDTLESA